MVICCELEIEYMIAPEKAFKWIIGIFTKHKVPFVVSGGLAARAYGSTRKLRDFDFDISNGSFKRILPDVAEYIESGPELHTSTAFKNTLLKLDYRGQEIDIAGAEDAEIYDKKRKKWVDDRTDLEHSEHRNIFNISVPVMNPRALILYKSKSPRPEDSEDIKAIKKYLKT